MIRPLDGIRVVDFTVAVAGPICSFVLADLGAEVIKVEELTRGQNLRGDMPAREGVPDRPWNRVSSYNELNRGKQSLAVDLAKPEGREIFLRLAAQADIVVENWSPRVVGNLGIDYEACRQVKPDIIYLSMPAFGKTGPYRDMRSYGPGIDAMSGLSHLTGYQDGPPLKPGNYYCDQNAGLHAAFAAMTALHHRRRTGEGQYIELPMIEGEIQVFAEAMIDFAVNGREQGRLGNRHPSIAPHGVYQCAGDDQWATIVAENDEQWWALCEAIGQPELANDPRFSDPVTRYHNQDALDAILGAWTADKNKHEVQRQLQAAGISAAAALMPADMFEDEHIRERGLFEFVDHPDSQPFPHTRVAFKLSDTPSPIRSSGALWAEANDYVLRDLLKMNEAEIAALQERNVIPAPRVPA